MRGHMNVKFVILILPELI